MVTKDKYTSMADNAARLVNFMEDLQEKCKELPQQQRSCAPLEAATYTRSYLFIFAFVK